MDNQSIVKKLAGALHVFGKADVYISFEGETEIVIKIISDFFEDIAPLDRIKLVSNVLADLLNTDLLEYETLILPQTESESKNE